MAIIYSYPLLTGTPADDDLLLITDKSDSNKTKSVKISQLPSGGGGSTSPAGLNTQVQYNDNGSFGASSKFKYRDSTRTLSIGEQDIDSGVVSIKGGANGGAGALQLGDDGTSGGAITLKAAGDVPSNYTITLPDSSPMTANRMLQSDASGNLTWIDKPSSGVNSCAVDTPSIITSSVTNNSLNVYMYQHVWTGGEYTPEKAKVYLPSTSVPSGKVGIGLYKGELSDPSSAMAISFSYSETLSAETGFKEIDLEDAGNGAMSAGDNCVFVFWMAGDGTSSEIYGALSMANSTDLCALSTSYSDWPEGGSASELQDIVDSGVTAPRAGVWLEFYK